MAPPTSGPRHTMGWPWGTKNWMEMTLTPYRSRGAILPPALAAGAPSRPIIRGMLGPVMSASRRPTWAPSRASDTARLVDTVLLPTPPLPDATASRFLTPGTMDGPVLVLARRTMAPQVMVDTGGARLREHRPDVAVRSRPSAGRRVS